MASSTLTITIKFKWWLKYIYLPVLSFVYWFLVNFTDRETQLDPDKVKSVIRRGSKMYIGGRELK